MRPSHSVLALLASASLILLVSPAGAVGVDGFFYVEVRDPTFLTFVETGERVTDTAVVLTLDPRELQVVVSLDGRGSASGSASANGTITNVLSEAVSGLTFIDFFFDVTGRFDAANEVVDGGFSTELLFGGDIVGGVGGGASFGPPGCSTFPCTESFFDGSSDFQKFTIGAGETLPVEVFIDGGASALAPIPLPAAAFPAALALAGLGWVGRQRARG